MIPVFTFSPGVSAAPQHTGTGSSLPGIITVPLPPRSDAHSAPPPLTQLLIQAASDDSQSRTVVRVLEVPRKKQPVAPAQSEVLTLPKPSLPEPAPAVNGKGAAAEKHSLASLSMETAPQVASVPPLTAALAAPAIPAAAVSQTAAAPKLSIEVTPEAAQAQRSPTSPPPAVEGAQEGQAPPQLRPDEARTDAAVVEGPEVCAGASTQPPVSKQRESHEQVRAPASPPPAPPSAPLTAASAEPPATSGIVAARKMFSSAPAGSSMADSAATSALPSGKLTEPSLTTAAGAVTCGVPCATHTCRWSTRQSKRDLGLSRLRS
jgi:hypothetical protein